MASVNKVILVGNLGRGPRDPLHADGDAITNIRLATTDKWKDKQSGEKQGRDRMAPCRLLRHASPRSRANTSRRARRSTSRAACTRASGRTRTAKTATPPRSWRTHADARQPRRRGRAAHGARARGSDERRGGRRRGEAGGQEGAGRRASTTWKTTFRSDGSFVTPAKAGFGRARDRHPGGSRGPGEALLDPGLRRDDVALAPRAAALRGVT